MNRHTTDLDPHHEGLINALLDGELSESQVAELEEAAAGDAVLGAALRDAREIQAMLGSMPALQAPPRLRRRLKAIPGLALPGFLNGWWPRLGLLAAGFLVVAVLLDSRGTTEPSMAEIQQGRLELDLALSYVGKAGNRTRTEIDARIGTALMEPFADHTAELLTHTPILNEEYEL